jgi:hypothetical protein
MPTEREGTRYLVILTLAGSSRNRLITLVPNLQNVLKGLSAEPIEQAFRSTTADTFGYFHPLNTSCSATCLSDPIARSHGTVSYQFRQPAYRSARR